MMYQGEKFNSFTHLVGSILSFIGVALLVSIAIEKGDIWKIIGFSVYGASLIMLYSVSTIYHSSRGKIKELFRQLDYISIYLLIAGTYTPFTLVTLRGVWGWSLFAVIWTLAIVGIIQEIYIGKKTRLYSLILYPLMGWIIVIAIEPLLEKLSSSGMYWLAAGGLAYTLGIAFFLLDEKVKHFHGVWHLFVLMGSFFQFVCLWKFVA